MAALTAHLLEQINTDRKTTIGIGGAPGSGKSTLARAMIHYAESTGLPACLLSLDDYYLDRKQRRKLAKQVHPLFQQRGVPGTHELDRLVNDLDRIQAGPCTDLRLPVFDKSTDDRAPEDTWRSLTSDPGLIILEGWCVGAKPPSRDVFFSDPSDWERINDPDGAWRGEVFVAWQQLYAALESRLDRVWYIRVPEWECVIDWRWQQECELMHGNLENRDEVEHFLGSFERIVHQMQKSCPQWAELILDANRDHEISQADRNRKTT